MSPVVTFYDHPPEARLPRIARLAEAAWERGRRLLVHCADAEDAEAIDRHLWAFKQESFIPHEQVAPGAVPGDPDARIVIVSSEHDPIGADILLLEGPASFEFAAGFKIVIEFVDHRSPQALADSRQRFKTWRQRGVNPEHKRA